MTSVSPTGKSLPVLKPLFVIEVATVPVLVVALGAVYVTCRGAFEGFVWIAEARGMVGDETGQLGVGA